MEALSFYVETYLERDVRDLLAVRNFSDFFRFLRLCAGRTAQVLNASSIAAGLPDDLFHYRDGSGAEIDLVEDSATSPSLVEIKSGQTPSADWTGVLRRLAPLFPGTPSLRIVYGGDERQDRTGAQFLPWRDFCAEMAAPPASAHSLRGSSSVQGLEKSRIRLS